MKPQKRAVVSRSRAVPKPEAAPTATKPDGPKQGRVPHDRNVTWSIAALIAAPPIAAVFLFGIGYPPGSQTTRAVFALALPIAVTLVSVWRVARRGRPDRPGAVNFARFLMVLDVVAAAAIAWYVFTRVF